MIYKLSSTQLTFVIGGNVCKCNDVAILSHQAEKFAVDCQKACCSDRLAGYWEWIGEHGGSTGGFCLSKHRSRRWFNAARALVWSCAAKIFS